MNAFVCHAGNQEELFLVGNKKYQECEYESALASYKGISRPGSACWYNIGNCQYHLGNYVDAIVAWRRAETDARWPDFADIDANYVQAYAQLAKQYPMSISNRITRYARRSISLLTVWAWQALLLFMWFAVAILLPIFIKNRHWWRLIFIVSFMSLISVLLLCRLHFQSKNYVIIVEPNIELRAGPGNDFATVAPAPLAEECTIKSISDEWLKISCTDGTGWIQINNVGCIDSDMNTDG